MGGSGFVCKIIRAGRVGGVCYPFGGVRPGVLTKRPEVAARILCAVLPLPFLRRRDAELLKPFLAMVL